ncbi:hypothetical protein HCN44_002233 [Aphidius gifuensis]|uniref:Uncharacterized protein n=1 Tax=Aphidius gifuensis TaxID=684658 RepID=A0A835CUM1_APHGI|nr:4-coumarate--CoA ligase 1-like [Aphidius gifuensis]KAF7996587.1 hypothetical protein HCN44_002233 [Aphidius gifuensis]
MFRLCLSRFKVQNSSKNNIKIFANYVNCIGENLNKKKYSTQLKHKIPERNQNIIDNDNIFHSPWQDIDIPDDVPLHDYVWKNVDKWWQKTAVVCSMTGRSYNYGQLRVLSGRFATSLKKLNLKPGNSLAAVLPNVPEFVIIAMGASEAGIPLTLINPLYTAREMNHQLENSDAGAVVTVSMRYQIVADAVNGKYPIIHLDAGNCNGPTGTINFKDLVDDSVVELEKTGEKININAANDSVILPYSSGTTGLPKGVELTHKNLVGNLTQINHPAFHLLEPAIGEFQDVNPIILPIFHSYGFSILCMGLSFGCKLICMPIFTPDSFLEICEKYPLTGLSVVPPIIQLMTLDPRFTKKHLKNLQAIVTGATSLNKELADKFLDKFGNSFALIKGYGLTETSPTITSGMNRPDDSVGLLLPNTKIKIIGQAHDNAGQSLGINQVGEILVKGPQVMKGYFKNPQGTLDTMQDDWLKTGDLGKITNDGDLQIAGRLKELIKVKGLQVSPIELEDLLHGHDKVADVAVVGVPHERFGEIPKAFIVAKQGVQITEDEIKNYVAKQVVDYKQLGQVVFIDKIPKSAVGKILRKQLENM